MTVENATHLLALGWLHGSDGLKAVALEFIRLHFQAVKATDGWAQVLKNEKLMNYVCSILFPLVPSIPIPGGASN